MADLQTVSITQSKIKVRWEEPYVSEAVNRMGSLFPRGVYRGFIAKEASVPDKTFELRSDPTGGGINPDSALVYWDRTAGFGLVVRETSDPSFDMSARFTDAGGTEIPVGGEIWWAWADVDYATSTATSGDYHVTLDGDPIPDDAVIFAKITMLAGDTTIQDSNISLVEMTEPFPTKREDGAYVADDQYFGYLSGEEAWNIPSLAQKRGLNAASPVPSTSNPFVTKDYLNGSLTEHVIPGADDTYDLGSAAYQWRDIYIDSVAYIDTLSLSDAAGEGCAANFVPTGDATYDLGSGSYQWKDLYLSGAATVDTLAVASNVTTDLIPVTHDTYDLGSVSSRWERIYSTDLTIERLFLEDDGSSGSGVAGGLVPTNANSYDVGLVDKRWGESYINEMHSKDLDVWETLKVAELQGGTMGPGMTREMLAKKAWYDLTYRYIYPWDYWNQIALGAGNTSPHDMCVLFLNNGEYDDTFEPTLYVVGAATGFQNEIAVVTNLSRDNSRSVTNQSTSAWTIAGDWRFDAICTDNESIYVQATKMDVTDQYEHRVFAFSVDTSGIPNGIKSGWTSSGALLAAGDTGDTPAVLNEGYPYGILAVDTYLITVNSWMLSTGSATQKCLSRISAASGAILGENSGQGSPATGYQYTGALGCDGTWIYFCMFNNGSADNKICRVAILNITNSAPAGTSVTGSVTAGQYCTSLLHDGYALWAAMGLKVYADINGVFGIALDYTDGVSTRPKHLCFDGKRLWYISADEAISNEHFIVAHAANIVDAGIMTTGSYVKPTIECFLTSPGEMSATTVKTQVGKAVFDGVDMWVICSEDGNGPGQIRRIRNVGRM